MFNVRYGVGTSKNKMSNLSLQKQIRQRIFKRCKQLNELQN